MARRLRIGIDVDGVIADFVTAFLEDAETLFKRPMPRATQTTWDFEDSLDITKDEVAQVWKHITASQNWFLLRPKAIPHVVTFLQDLAIKHELYFVTSRKDTVGYTAKEQTEFFLNGLGIDFPTVLANFNKGEIAAALKLHAFIDDYPKNAEIIAAKSSATKGFLMNATYNQDYKGPWERVASFEEFAAKIEDIANE